MEAALDKALVERFAALFRGNPRSYGAYLAETGAKTIKAPYTIDNYEGHLSGEMGMGLVPVLDDGTCWFAVIDVDIKGEDHARGDIHVNIFEIEEKARRAELPLMICRSKSGGVHCYVFFKEPQKAADVRLMLTRWEVLIGHPGAEIFPKQANLVVSQDGGRALGNWINLPYFDVEETSRYCVDGGKEVSLDYFLSLAEGRRCTTAQFEKQAGEDYQNGPPCLQRMMAQRIEEGNRNVAVFQAGIFLRRAFPDDWRQRVDMFNRMALVTPLDLREVRQIAGSVGRKTYQYKCREDPCRALCDRETCKTRTYGITADDERANEMPQIDKVEKIQTTPILWRLTLKGKLIELTTSQLFNNEIFRQAVFERLHILTPPMKKHEWEQHLSELTSNIVVVQATTIEDMYMDRVLDFCKRASPNKNLPEDTRRDCLRRGMPALIAINKLGTEENEWFYAFRVNDFIEYLRRRKQLTLPDYQIPTILGKILNPDNKRAKLRVCGTTVSNVWCVPEAMIGDESVPMITHKPEY